MKIGRTLGTVAFALPLLISGGVTASTSSAATVDQTSAPAASRSASTTAKTVCFNQKKHKSKVVAGGRCAGKNWKQVANLGKKLAKVSASAKQNSLCIRNASGQAKVVTTKKCPKGYKKYTAAKLGLVGPAGPTGPTGASAPSSVNFWVDNPPGPGAQRLLIGNYDPSLSYSFSGTPSASFTAVAPCTNDPSDAYYGLGCVTVSGQPNQWILVAANASINGVTSTTSKVNVQLSDALPGIPSISITGVTDEEVTADITQGPGGAVDHWECKVTNSDDTIYQDWKSCGWEEDGPTVDVYNLLAATSYKLTVRAVNDSGTGTASVPVPFITTS